MGAQLQLVSQYECNRVLFIVQFVQKATAMLLPLVLAGKVMTVKFSPLLACHRCHPSTGHHN